MISRQGRDDAQAKYVKVVVVGGNCSALVLKNMWTEQTGPVGDICDVYLGGEDLESLTVQRLS